MSTGRGWNRSTGRNCSGGCNSLRRNPNEFSVIPAKGRNSLRNPHASQKERRLSSAHSVRWSTHRS